MEERSYEGWSDRATWVLNLWWSNEEDSYRHLRGVILDALREYDEEEDLGRETTIGIAADLLETDWDEAVDRINNGMIRNAIPTPDFREVAIAWVDEEMLQKAKSA